MPTIPDPEELVEIAQSAQRKVEDREWKKYQRYLNRHQKKYGDPPSEPPITFELFCAWLRHFDKNPAESQNSNI
jgi:hypothetical protein